MEGWNILSSNPPWLSANSHTCPERVGFKPAWANRKSVAGHILGACHLALATCEQGSVDADSCTNIVSSKNTGS